MTIIYLTDDATIKNKLIEAEKTCILIKTTFNASINSVGYVLRTIIVNSMSIDICLNTFNKESLNLLNDLIKSNDEIALVNSYKPTEQSQFNFDMLLTQISEIENIMDIKRLWINDPCDTINNADISINKLPDNSEFKNMSHYYLTKRVIDLFWMQSALISHSNYELSIHQYYILSLIHQQEELIKSTKQSMFYTVDAKVGGFSGKVITKGHFKFYSLDTAQSILELCNKDFLVYKSKFITRTAPKHQLFTLPTLVKLMNNSENLLETLNNLFSKGFITNPLTKNHYIPSSMIDTVISSLNSFSQRYSPLITHINTHGIPTNELIEHIMLNYVDDQIIKSDHTHAIIPISKSNMSELSDNEIAVYDTIVYRYLSIFLSAPITYTKTIEAYNGNSIFIKLKKDSYLSYGSEMFEIRKDNVFEELKIDTSKLESIYSIGDSISSNELDLCVNGNLTRISKPISSTQLHTKLMNMGKKIIPRHLKTKNRHFTIGEAHKWKNYINKLEEMNLIFIDDNNNFVLSDAGIQFLNNSKAFLINTKNLNSLYIDLVRVYTGEKDLITVITDHIRTIQSISQGLNYGDTRTANYQYIINNYKCICGSSLKDHENFLGCTKYPSCKFTISKVISSGKTYKMSEKDIIELLTQKKTSTVIENFKFKSGKSANISFKIEDNMKVGYTFYNKYQHNKNEQ